MVRGLLRSVFWSPKVSHLPHSIGQRDTQDQFIFKCLEMQYVPRGRRNGMIVNQRGIGQREAWLFGAIFNNLLQVGRTAKY